MENNFEKFNDVINLIEKHIQDEINIEELAKYMNLSVYEFRRIFSFVAGVPIGEYIKNRRLSTAAEELLQGKDSLSGISQKYGYSSVSSFSRAFKEFHGFSPNEIRENKIRMFTKLSVDFLATGADNIEYRIVSEDGFFINGICMLSDISDTECCEAVWEEFYNKNIPDKFKDNEKIYSAYENTATGVRCTIGQRNLYEGTYIKPSLWAVFKMNRTEDSYVNEFYLNVLNKWLSSSNYQKRNDMQNLEVYPLDMDNDGFEWEIYIPIKED